MENIEPKTILNMLDTLLYSNKPSKEKLDTLKNVYNITISDSIIEEVNTMCNLGEGLYEKLLQKNKLDKQSKQKNY